MANNIQNWNRASGSNLKLSDVLKMYYSNEGVFNQDMRACKRKTNSNIPSTDDLEEQVYYTIIVYKIAIFSRINFGNFF